MKKDVLKVVTDVAGLLSECGWREKADWFLEVGSRIHDLEDDSVEFLEELRSLSQILVGMGSFTDLPLIPVEGSTLTELEARARQWDLAEDLGRLIRQVLK